MKFLSFILVSLTAIFLTSCTKLEQNNGLRVFLVGGFAIAAAVCLYKVWEGYNSGTTQQKPEGIEETKTGKEIPVGLLVWAAVLILAAIGSNAWVVAENRKYDPKKDDPYPTSPAPDGRESAEDQAAKADSVYNLKK